MGAPIGDAHDIAAYDAKVAKWQANNPGTRYSDYSEYQLARHLELRRPHASLGTNLSSGNDWKADGAAPFNALCGFLSSATELETLPRNFIFCDYGCGTLRLGWHLMKHLYLGGYCGLDLSERIIDFGRQACGDLIAEKAPLLGSFRDTLSEAVAMQPDLVFAFNVACHVHPDETKEFYSNIKALCAKPGSIAIVHVLTHQEEGTEELRYQRSGWAWPLKHVRAALQPMEVLEEINFKAVQKGPHELMSYYLVVQSSVEKADI